MPLPCSSKEKSARIDWGYINRPGRLVWVRGWLWVAAAVLVAGPAVAATVAAVVTDGPPRPLASAASRGPLAAPHAAWEERCDACHVPFEPINGDRWPARLFGGSSPAGRTVARCESCHAGPPHHPAERADSAPGCADCHRDHRGRDASLVRLADAVCVRCHGDPAAARVGTHITGFADPAAHPEFRAVGEPAGHRRTLKFSHAAHGADLRMTFEAIDDPAQRERYMKLAGATDPAAPVKLSCAACHQLDAGLADPVPANPRPDEAFAELTRGLLHGQPRGAVQPPRAAGAHFLPVNFEAHCRACHPLTFDEAAPQVQAPHRVQPDEVARFLRGFYAERFLSDQLKKLPEPDRGPGRLDPRPVGPAPASLRERVERDVADAVRRAGGRLLGGAQGCEKCHETESRQPDRVAAVSTPTVWMTRARFDHTSHRAVDCRLCHPNADTSKADELARAAERPAGGSLAPQYRHPPDLPGVANCRSCHSPAGGVRHGCTDCHVYHHADRGLQGRGSPSRAPARPQDDLPGFLRGR
jgi:hypothetical protein